MLKVWGKWEWSKLPTDSRKRLKLNTRGHQPSRSTSLCSLSPFFRFSAVLLNCSISIRMWLCFTWYTMLVLKQNMVFKMITSLHSRFALYHSLLPLWLSKVVSLVWSLLKVILSHKTSNLVAFLTKPKISSFWHLLVLSTSFQ